MSYLKVSKKLVRGLAKILHIVSNLGLKIEWKLINYLYLDDLRLSKQKSLTEFPLINLTIKNKSPATLEGIIITTFEKRLFSHCLPLVDSIRCSEVHKPIYIVINGNLSGKAEASLRQRFVSEIIRYQPLGLVTLEAMFGMSHNWNLGLRLSNFEIAFVLSDDIVVNKKIFSAQLNSLFEYAREKDFTLVNDGFSSFIFTDRVRQAVGPFDEFFVGFGDEDGDFAWRYEQRYNESLPNYKMSSIFHLADHSQDEEVTGLSKYSLANNVYLHMKYKFGVGDIRGLFSSVADSLDKTLDSEPHFHLRRNSRTLLSLTSRDAIQESLQLLKKRMS